MKNQKTLFSINKAGYTRKKFSIFFQEPGKKWKKFNSPQGDELNDGFLSGCISYEECFAGFKEILESLYESRDKTENDILSENQRHIDQYYAFKYLKKSRQRRLAKSTLDSAYNDLLRAVKAIGDLDLRFARVDKLQERVDEFYENYPTITPHARTVMRINSVMKFLGRAEKDRLESLPEDHVEVKNLQYDEAKVVIESLEGFNKVLSEIAYFSGLRIGEIFSLTKKSVRNLPDGGCSLLVNSQMLRSGEISLPKRRKIRKVFALKGCQKSLAEWVQIDMNTRKKIRQRKYAKIVQDACIKLETSQVIAFKDWRHCYAINLLNGGATLSQVASNLGNSEAVCRKHYIGYTLTNDGIDIVARNFRQNSREFETF